MRLSPLKLRVRPISQLTDSLVMCSLDCSVARCVRLAPSLCPILGVTDTALPTFISPLAVDEYDEATALMPALCRSSGLPRERDELALDEDGEDLPSDWYLSVCSSSLTCPAFRC